MCNRPCGQVNLYFRRLENTPWRASHFPGQTLRHDKPSIEVVLHDWERYAGSPFKCPELERSDWIVERREQ